MHFPIIELQPHPIPVDERLGDYELYDDACIGYFTDYVGDEYSEEARKVYIESGSLQGLLAGIATVDTASETIVFLDADTIRDTITKHILDSIADLQKEALGGRGLRPNDLTYAGDYWRGHEELFYVEGCAHTSGAFISSAIWYAGKTLYIGAIFDAHI